MSLWAPQILQDMLKSFKRQAKLLHVGKAPALSFQPNSLILGGTSRLQIVLQGLLGELDEGSWAFLMARAKKQANRTVNLPFIMKCQMKMSAGQEQHRGILRIVVTSLGLKVTRMTSSFQ